MDDFAVSPCRQVDSRENCTIVIFGGSGDLTSRKLIPALFRLFRKGYLPASWVIIGCGRTDFDDESYRQHLHGCCSAQDTTLWSEFCQRVYYLKLDYQQPGHYDHLSTRLRGLDLEHGTAGNLLLDLAVPPELYPVIAQRLGEAGLARPLRQGGWVRMVVEKPFGRDYQSAMALDDVLHRYFAEEQIFRIDHYLAKETVQNILSLRYANHIFEPLWNRNHIEWVGIVSSEQLGVEKRAGYYDSSGVLRDMFQNHMMQLLALVAMEPPSRFEAEAIRDEKVKVFRSIIPFSGKDSDIVLGQYGPGEIAGSAVRGYLDEDNIKENSRTPTYAMLKLDIDNWRWQGVPFYLISGKRLQRKETRIVIHFKDAPLAMFRGVVGEHVSHNKLVISIYPSEAINLSIQAKVPGPKLCLRTASLDFTYAEDDMASLEAYEKVLLDCISGDHMLFWRRDGIASTWKLISPILDDCEGTNCRIQKLHTYRAGSWGPEAALCIAEKIVR